MLQRLGYQLIAISVFMIGFLFSLSLTKKAHLSSYKWNSTRLGAYEVCRLVRDRFFEPSEQLRDWYKDCRSLVDTVNKDAEVEAVVDMLQAHLEKLNVSHLFLNKPSEEKVLWHGIKKETGLRVRNFGGYLVVAAVIDGSPAEKANFRPGDIIEEINGRRALFVREAHEEAGTFKVRRGKQLLTIYCGTAEIKIDKQPVLESMSKTIGYLRISSYRPEYFSKESWLEIASKLPNFYNIIVDLRGNLGGNFAAMLRSLSPFFCNEIKIGELQRPRKMTEKSVPLPDNLDGDIHFGLLDTVSRVDLVTYPFTPCYANDLIVLIDEDTASVSEIFASAIKENNRGQVLGKVSAGQVLLAVWYEIPEFGRGYSLSIPEAIYQSNQGKQYESQGVQPHKILEYKYSDATKGLDSWLELSKKFFVSH